MIDDLKLQLIGLAQDFDLDRLLLLFGWGVKHGIVAGLDQGHFTGVGLGASDLMLPEKGASRSGCGPDMIESAGHPEYRPGRNRKIRHKGFLLFCHERGRSTAAINQEMFPEQLSFGFVPAANFD